VHTDCARYDSLNQCLAIHKCVDGDCRPDPSTAVVCEGGHPAPCKIYGCHPDWGLCVDMPGPEGSPCDDGAACTVGDHCEQGGCVPGTPKDCDDQNLCTEDSCDPETGICMHKAVGCDDSDPCTDDFCEPDGSCRHSATDCTDGNQCTIDSCEPAQGGCVRTPIGCDDGSECTIDKCNPATGECEHEPNPECLVGFDELNTDLLMRKCVPCHLDGADPVNAPKFVNDYVKITGQAPRSAECARATPYKIGPCLVIRAVENGTMPPTWARASIWLGDQMDGPEYDMKYTLTEDEKLLIVQWVESGMLE